MKEIPLTKGFIALVDDENVDSLKQFNWHAHTSKTHNHVYAARRQWVNGKKLSILMHRVIMGNPMTGEVDHINRNSLDNRRCNLRLATRQQNGANNCYPNKSGLKGVTRVKNNKSKPWQAQISVMWRNHYLGNFATKEEAHAAYSKAARKHFGEFARIESNDI